MGALLSRGAAAVGATPTRTIPAAAHKADAAAKAAIAKAQSGASFPAMPAVPPGMAAPPPPPMDEEAANRGVVDMLNQTSFNTRATPTSGAADASLIAVEEEAENGLPLDSLIEALRLHGEDATKWDAPTLAQKYGIVDVGLFSDALSHCRTYSVIEDEQGRPRGVAIGDEANHKKRTVQDLFTEFAEDDVTPAPRALPPPTGGGGGT